MINPIARFFFETYPLILVLFLWMRLLKLSSTKKFLFDCDNPETGIFGMIFHKVLDLLKNGRR